MIHDFTFRYLFSIFKTHTVVSVIIVAIINENGLNFNFSVYIALFPRLFENIYRYDEVKVRASGRFFFFMLALKMILKLEF